MSKKFYGCKYHFLLFCKIASTTLVVKFKLSQGVQTWKKLKYYIIFSKKKKMSKNRGDANEKLLFHGTSPDTIDHICARNFDFRMSGKNATLYGKGSYFATTASYSHRYTSKDSDGNFSMFLAQVLVGKYTQVLIPW